MRHHCLFISGYDAGFQVFHTLYCIVHFSMRVAASNEAYVRNENCRGSPPVNEAPIYNE